MCAATFGELPACLLAKFQTCLSILLGNSQHVHDFLADVPNMCTDFLGEFPTCACFLGGKFESPMSTGILGSSKCPLISWVISHMTNCFVEVEESSKCITFSLGTCLSSIGFQVRYLTCASVSRASQVASIGCNCLWFDKKNNSTPEATGWKKC